MPRNVVIETIKTPIYRGEYETSLYRGSRPNGMASDFEDVIVLAPGWLGSGTLHFAASTLARHGHDVAVVQHGKRSWLAHNAVRSQNVHFAARAASQATGKRGVIFIGHSNGGQDIHHASAKAIERQQAEPDNSELYVVRAVGAMASAGLSGRQLDLRSLGSEAIGASHNLVRHPNEELAIVGRSLWNFIKDPILAAAEGISAARCDVRPQAGQFVGNEGVRAYVEEYMDHDGVIPMPVERGGYLIRSGTHMTPLIDEGIMPELAVSLYEQQDLTAHELRVFHAAA